MKKEEVPQNISAFPLGKENTGFKQYLQENPGWHR